MHAGGVTHNIDQVGRRVSVNLRRGGLFSVSLHTTQESRYGCIGDFVGVVLVFR